MADILTDSPVAPPEPPAALPGDDAPLSAHIEAFQPDRLETRDGENGAQTEKDQRRHRRQKDLARADDVPRIRELSGKVKDAETRAEAASREAKEWREKYEATTRTATSTSQPAPAKAEPTAPTAAAKFTHPTYDEALAKDPALSYEDYTDQRSYAYGRWNQAREAQAQTERQTQQQQADADAAMVQKYQAVVASHQQRLSAYVQQYPDRRAAFEQLPDTSGSPIFNAALLQDDNSPDLLYRLRQNGDVLFDEAVLFAEGKPFSEANVARMQRWLHQRVSSGVTGAEPPAPSITPAPRPPTPVRTTPVPPTDDPPGDHGSLRDHQKAFYKGRH